MGLRETAQKLAHKGITRIAGNVTLSITYRAMLENVSSPTDPLSTAPTFQDVTVQAVVDMPRGDTEGLFRNLNAQSGADLRKEQYADPARLLLSKTDVQQQLGNVTPKRGDRFVLWGGEYQVDAVRFDDPAQATYHITGTRVSGQDNTYPP